MTKETKIISEILRELKVAEEKHPDWPSNIFQQVTIISEEAGEIAKAALHIIEGKGDLDNLKNEIIQTAAMCVRMLKNMDQDNKKVITNSDQKFYIELRITSDKSGCTYWVTQINPGEVNPDLSFAGAFTLNEVKRHQKSHVWDSAYFIAWPAKYIDNILEAVKSTTKREYLLITDLLEEKSIKMSEL